MNEIGLDPGIDHLTACQVFDQVKDRGRIQSFVSWCGGLPAPECSDNPLGYKFSWSPQGVLMALLNPAKYKLDGVVHTIPGSQLLEKIISNPVDAFKGFALEGLPNRDSLSYIDQYGLSTDIKTMFRGTLRYKGFSSLLSCFNQLGFLSNVEFDKNIETWVNFKINILY